VPIMKLTLTLLLDSAIFSNGLGVARGSGGSEASQSVPAEACSSAENLESCKAEAQVWRSRAARVLDVGPAETRKAGPTAEARQLAEAKATGRRNASHPRTVMLISRALVGLSSGPEVLKGNRPAKSDFLDVVDKTILNSDAELDRGGHGENHCSWNGRLAGAKAGPPGTVQRSKMGNYESEYVEAGWPTFSGHLFFCNAGVHTTSGRVATPTSPESAISGATSRSASTSVRNRTRSISLLRRTSYMFFMATMRGPAELPKQFSR